MTRLSMVLLFTVFNLFFFSAIASSVEAPDLLLYQKNGAAANDQLGASVASAGDVDGDGGSDFIVGAPLADPAGIDRAGSVYVYSGNNGVLLYQKDGDVFQGRFGYSVGSAGDVNNDGRGDFIIGAPGAGPPGPIPPGSAFVYSGADGSLLYAKSGVFSEDFLGISVGGVGDVNGDGFDDFIAGARRIIFSSGNGAGAAYVYSGADGSLLYEKLGDAPSDFLGESVAGAGDINGDGRTDFVIGAPRTDPGGVGEAGSAYVYSGATGNLLYQKDGTAAGDGLGSSVAGAGDVDGDGRADFIIGVPYADPAGGFTARGYALVYSGATGTLLYQKIGFSDEFLGTSVAGAGDVDGDGKQDFIAGSPFAPGGPSGFGSTFLYSGATGGLFLKLNGSASGDNFGWSVSSAGDVDGDGKADFLVGARLSNPSGLTDAGSVFVYSPCAAAKGDANINGILTPSDVVLALYRIFAGSGGAPFCLIDLNCDGVLTSSDVMLELNAVFLDEPPPC